MPSSRESSWPRDRTRVSCIAGRFFTSEPPGKPIFHLSENFFNVHFYIFTLYKKIPFLLEFQNEHSWWHICWYFLRVNNAPLFGKSFSLSDPKTPNSPLPVLWCSIASKRYTWIVSKYFYRLNLINISETHDSVFHPLSHNTHQYLFTVGHTVDARKMTVDWPMVWVVSIYLLNPSTSCHSHSHRTGSCKHLPSSCICLWLSSNQFSTKQPN